MWQATMARRREAGLENYVEGRVGDQDKGQVLTESLARIQDRTKAGRRLVTRRSKFSMSDRFQPWKADTLMFLIKDSPERPRNR